MNRKRKMTADLNELTTELRDGTVYSLQAVIHESENVSVYFRNIKRHILSSIEAAKRVYGCVAWLTDLDILDALAKKEQVGIVLNKEDFINPDDPKCWDSLKKKWEQLPLFTIPSSYFKWQKDGFVTLPNNELPIDTSTEKYVFVHSGSFGGDPFTVYQRLKLIDKNVDFPIDSDEQGYPEFHLLTKLKSAGTEVDPLRCVGCMGTKGSHPRMHNKFLVLVNDTNWWVITGSFNFSANSTNSLENVIVVRDKSVVRTYLEEWQQIFAVSESRTATIQYRLDFHRVWGNLFASLGWNFVYHDEDYFDVNVGAKAKAIVHLSPTEIMEMIAKRSNYVTEFTPHFDSSLVVGTGWFYAAELPTLLSEAYGFVLVEDTQGVFPFSFGYCHHCKFHVPKHHVTKLCIFCGSSCDPYRLNGSLIGRQEMQ